MKYDSHTTNQPGKRSEKRMPRWLVPLLVATSILIILAVGAFLLYGRELFQRPFLAIGVVIAWLGALVGISIGGETDKS